MYFATHEYVVGALKAVKGPQCGKNGGQKYKILNFEVNFLFRTL